MTWKQVGARQSWVCANCSTAVDETAELDHLIPLSSGGTDDVLNAQLLCVSCHKRKSQLEEQERIVALRARLSERQRQKNDSCASNHKNATRADVVESVLNAPCDAFNFADYVYSGFLADRRHWPV